MQQGIECNGHSGTVEWIAVHAAPWWLQDAVVGVRTIRRHDVHYGRRSERLHHASIQMSWQLLHAKNTNIHWILFSGSYYACLNRKAYRRQCAPQLLYNMYTGKCELATGGRWADVCQSSGAPVRPLPDEDWHDAEEITSFLPPWWPASQSQSPHESEANLPQPQEQQQQQPPPASLPPSQQPIEWQPNNDWPTQQQPTEQIQLVGLCVGRPDYYVRGYPNDCTKFVHCYREQVTVIDCANEFFWNESKLQCLNYRPAGC